MSVKTMTARDAKIQFGTFMNTMQREPVIVTKNDKPVGIMISIEDAANTLIPDMFLEKEAGYDEWFQEKVSKSLKAFTEGVATVSAHDEVMDRVWRRVQLKALKIS
jgi:prevent-host-death family protein